MPAATRLVDLGTRLAVRHAHEVGDEFRERRLTLGATQQDVADACRMSRVRYGKIESGTWTNVTLLELDRIATVLGLSPSVRLYPAGPGLRDAGHVARLRRVLEHVKSPLTWRLEVALPARGDRTDLRAWDAMLFGVGVRTAIELEMRLRDVQALIRRIDLKRRDDPTAGFLLLVADTRGNRRLLAEFAAMLGDLPRLRPSTVYAALERGEHPGTGIVLV
jgi:transcriptional regulator with XRE-family HTH domain